MQWIEVSVVVTTEAVDATTILFERCGMDQVAIEDRALWKTGWAGAYGELYTDPPADLAEGTARVSGYLASLRFDEGLPGRLQQEIDALPSFPGARQSPVVTTRVDEEDWANAWKQDYHVTHISDRLVVRPEWESYDARPGEHVIIMDPGMAFGTGTHATTALCMRALGELVSAGDRIIDVGCGSAILSIASAKLGADEVLAIDLDPLAVKVAQENVDRNDVSSIVHVEVGDLLGEAASSRAWDGIVANILAEVVIRLIPDLHKHVPASGWALLSGIIVEKRDMVADVLTQHGFFVSQEWEQDGWAALLARRAGDR